MMKKLSLLSGHVLRLLATFHWIREVTPDVFTNNRLSSYIDSGKSAEQLKNACVFVYSSSPGCVGSHLVYCSPGSKYDGSDGVAAYCAVGYVLSRAFPCSSTPITESSSP